MAPRMNANILDLLEEDTAGSAVPETSHFGNQFTPVEHRQRREDPISSELQEPKPRICSTPISIPFLVWPSLYI